MSGIELTGKANDILTAALNPFVLRRDGDISGCELNVRPGSKLAKYLHIDTNYGPLAIKINNHLPVGRSYITDGPGMSPRGMEWVT